MKLEIFFFFELEINYNLLMYKTKDFTIFVKLNTYSANLESLKKEFIDFSSSFRYNE